MAELSQTTKNLISQYALWLRSQTPKEGIPTIHVDEVAMRVAAFYEKIRTIVEWKEEHLMRRAAIIRKLKRRFFDLELKNYSTTDVGENLVLELIRGGYFPNDKIEEVKIKEVQAILDKYAFILKQNPENKNGKAGVEFYNHLLEIAACEIEETLAPSIKEMALIDYMFENMRDRVKINQAIYDRELLTPEDKDIQLYIAIQQALFKLDTPIISYNLIRYKYPQWNNPDEEELIKFSQNMHKIIKTIENDLACPLAKKFYTICEKYDTAYLLIGDVLSSSKDFQQTQQDIYEPSLLEERIKAAYHKRMHGLKAKITRAAIYSTLSIFITKILSLVILEVILAKVFGMEFNGLILAADIAIPTLLMAVLVMSVKRPSKKNINLVLVEVMKIFYEKEKVDTYEIRVAKKRGPVTRALLSLTYIMGAVFSFGIIYLVFHYFHFPLTSIVINIIFIALILYAGTAIQNRSAELTIEENSGGFVVFVTDILFLPVTSLGRWMSNKWKKYNALTAFLNALIDMPFSLFVEFLERWRYFIKERKEEMR